jgi:homospermidine synthase
VLFPVSAVLYSGAIDECVEVESGFVSSCTLVRCCGEAAMLVVHFVKKAAAVASVAARQRVDQVRFPLGICRR